MKIIYTEKGKAKGTVSVTRTMGSMEVGDTWDILCDMVPIERARAYASAFSRLTNRWYTVNIDKEHPGLYVITRTK